MKKLNLLNLGIATGALLLPVVAHSGVLDNNSPHNFTTRAWNTALNFPGDPNSVCGPCHQAHNTDSSVVPLWAHDTAPAGSFKMYNTLNVPVSRMQATVETQPQGPSLACLSCHDGTVAINQMAGGRILGGTPDTMPLRGVINKKPDGSPDPGNLTHTHPISLVYDSDLALTRDKGVYDPAVTSVLKPDAGAWWGQGSSPDLTIKNFLLNGGNHLECTSCHDVHNAKGSQFDATLNPNLLILAGSRNGQGSLLCRSCHNK